MAARALAGCQIKNGNEFLRVGSEIQFRISNQLTTYAIDPLADRYRHKVRREIAKLPATLTAAQDLGQALQAKFISGRVGKWFAIAATRIGEDIDQHQYILTPRRHKREVRFDVCLQLSSRSGLGLYPRLHIRMELPQDFAKDLLDQLVLVREMIRDDALADSGSFGNLRQRCLPVAEG